MAKTAKKPRYVDPATKTRGKPSAWLKVKDRIGELADLYAHGATMEQLAKVVGIGVATLNYLKAEYRDLREALAHAREQREELIASDMWQLARGGAVRVEKIKRLNSETGKMEVVGERELHLEPQLNAQLSYLKQYHGWSDNPVKDKAVANALNDAQLRAKFCERLGLANYCNTPAPAPLPPQKKPDGSKA